MLELVESFEQGQFRSFHCPEEYSYFGFFLDAIIAQTIKCHDGQILSIFVTFFANEGLELHATEKVNWRCQRWGGTWYGWD
jgi:hypothetical protein